MLFKRDFILDPSLVLYLPLWKTDGASLMSQDAYGHLCVVVGALWRPFGRYFNGTSNLINTNVVLTPLATTIAGTWMAWFQVTVVEAATRHDLISFGDESVDSCLDIYTQDGYVKGDTRLGGVNQWVLASDDRVVSPNTWHQLAIVQNGTSPILYFNGIAIPQTFSITTDKTIWFAGIPLLDRGRLGALRKTSANLYYLDGYLGLVCLYNRVLTPQEIQHNYLATKGRYQ